MFEKPEKTQFPPRSKPEMIWDGKCGFCEYWTIRWESITGQKVLYRPYQLAAEDYPDIPTRHFTEASRLIETDGRIFSGPHSAYRTLTYGSKWAFLNRWYENNTGFRKFSDRLYQFIANHRPAMFRITKFLWGSNPREVRPFWFIYLVLIVYISIYGW